MRCEKQMRLSRAIEKNSDSSDRRCSRHWLVAGLLAAGTASGCGPEPRSSQPGAVDRRPASVSQSLGVSTMDQREAFTRVLKEYPSNPAAQEALIAKTVDEARLSARTAASLLQNSDSDLAFNAESFLRSIDDLAVQPLLEASVPADPTLASSYIDLLVEPELELRKKVLSKIDTLLDDRRPIPLRPVLGVKPEQPPKPRRVCDDAYVAMRSLIYFGEDLVEQFIERDKFLSESEEARYKAITRARQSPVWQRALGHEPGDSPNGQHGSS